MPYYYCSIPNKGLPGEIRELISDDQEKLAAFVSTWDRPGRAVYYCPNPLKAGATRRCIENVEAIVFLWVDIDYKDLVETPEEIQAKLLHLPLQPTEVRNSGNGLHLIWELRESVDADDAAGFAGACELYKQLARGLSGDPLPAHPAALLRVPGTHNSKPRPAVAGSNYVH